jgi:predicted RNase H-like HicB family nuclease
MTKQRALVAQFEVDEYGHWLVGLVGVPQCHTFGRSFRSAVEHIYEAAAVWFDCEPADLDITYRLPREYAAVARRVKQARTKAADAQDAAARLLLSAVHELEAEGLSRRDIAEILGLSHQRVHQLAGRPAAS